MYYDMSEGMNERAAVKAGDVVYVHDVNQRRGAVPQNPLGEPATIIKVGRKLVTVSYEGQYRSWTETFRLDTGQVNDAWGRRSFLTQSQAEALLRHTEARAKLRVHGITLEPGHRLTLEQMEAVAALLHSPISEDV